MKDLINEVIKSYKQSLKATRPSPTYEAGAVGFSSLLYCPLKNKYRTKEIYSVETLEIYDGFDFELKFKDILADIAKSLGAIRVVPDTATGEEFVVKYKIGELTLNGHLDVFIEFNDKNVIYEMKNIRMVQVDTLPQTEIVEDLPITPSYLLQAGMQATITSIVTNKPTEAWVFCKTTCIDSCRRSKKVFGLIKAPPVPMEEIEEKVNSFLTKREPVYSWECKYCPYISICEYQQKLTDSINSDLV